MSRTYTFELARVPTVDAVLASPTTHRWLRDALRAAMADCDPVDALKNTEILYGALCDRWERMRKLSERAR